MGRWPDSGRDRKPDARDAWPYEGDWLTDVRKVGAETTASRGDRDRLAISAELLFKLKSVGVA
jgi:hypothetical protein